MLVTSRSRLVSTSEAAEILRVSPRTVINWIKKDLIPYVELPGGEYRIPLNALLRSLPGTFDLSAELEAVDEEARQGDLTEEEAIAIATDA
jgi:excisionase family DNA binding protein